MTIGKRDCLLYPALHKQCVLGPDTGPLRHREVSWLVQGHTGGGTEARFVATYSQPGQPHPFSAVPRPTLTVETGPRDPASLPHLLPGSRVRVPPRQEYSGIPSS